MSTAALANSIVISLEFNKTDSIDYTQKSSPHIPPTRFFITSPKTQNFYLLFFWDDFHNLYMQAPLTVNHDGT